MSEPPPPYDTRELRDRVAAIEAENDRRAALPVVPVLDREAPSSHEATGVCGLCGELVRRADAGVRCRAPRGPEDRCPIANL